MKRTHSGKTARGTERVRAGLCPLSPPVKGAAGADAAIGRILPGLMLAVVAGVAVGAALSAPPAMAAPIENRTAVFAGLDKITGEITTFSVPINETKPFGSLSVTPRTCHTRPVTEEPRTMAFVEVDERLVNGGSRRIFTGWMNAESPGLNAVEHPIFDVWLTGCRDPLPEKAQDGQARRGAVPLRPEKTGLKKAPGG